MRKKRGYRILYIATGSHPTDSPGTRHAETDMWGGPGTGKYWRHYRTKRAARHFANWFNNLSGKSYWMAYVMPEDRP